MKPLTVYDIVPPEHKCDNCGGLIHTGQCVEIWRIQHQADKAAKARRKVTWGE